MPCRTRRCSSGENELSVGQHCARGSGCGDASGAMTSADDLSEQKVKSKSDRACPVCGSKKSRNLKRLLFPLSKTNIDLPSFALIPPTHTNAANCASPSSLSRVNTVTVAPRKTTPSSPPTRSRHSPSQAEKEKSKQKIQRVPRSFPTKKQQRCLAPPPSGCRTPRSSWAAPSSWSGSTACSASS